MLLLLGTTCGAATTHHVPTAPHLKVANNLNDGPITVVDLPGCCAPCGDRDVVGPSVWVACGQGVVEDRREGTMELHVGPYLLPYLQVQVKEQVWCVEPSALELVTAGGTLAVGPRAGHSGSGPFSGATLEASVSDPPCVYRCNPDV